MPSSYDIWKTTPPDDKPGFSEAEDYLGKTIILRDEDDDPRFTQTGTIIDFELETDQDEDGWHSELVLEVRWEGKERTEMIREGDLGEYELS